MLKEKKNSIKNSEIQSLKEFIALNRKFSDFLTKFNILLEGNNVTEAMDLGNFIKEYTESIQNFDGKLPSRDAVEELGYLQQIKDQQELIANLATKTEHLLSVHSKLAKKAVEFATFKLEEKAKDTSCYDREGNIALPKDRHDPISFVDQI